MAKSLRSSPYAFPAEIARYLAVEPRDVKRMIKLDKLPVTKIPKETKSVDRIYLPDFHTWILNRSTGANDRLRSYQDFLAEFTATARTPESSPELEKAS